MKNFFTLCCVYNTHCYFCDTMLSWRDDRWQFLEALDSITFPRKNFFSENRGTRPKYRPNINVINQFPVPQGAWDKGGTKVGQGRNMGLAVFAKYNRMRGLMADSLLNENNPT